MQPSDLEDAYRVYMSDLRSHLPDGVVEVDLPLMEDLGVFAPELAPSQSLTYNFYVIESTEKLTLFNEKFSVWIVPQVVEEVPTTYTFIARNYQNRPCLEMAFATSGAYNHSHLVLEILERFLLQIDENEEEMHRLETD